MFLDDIFDDKGSDDKSNIFNPAELLQNSWSDGSHQQIFASPNPTNLLPSVEFNSGSNDRAQPKSFLSKLLPDFDDLPKLPGLPNPGDLPKPPGLANLPELPGLPNPGDLPQAPGLADLPKLPGLPSPGDLPRVPELPNIGQLPHFSTPGNMFREHPPALADIIGSSSPLVGEFLRTELERLDRDWSPDRHRPYEPPHWNPEHGGPVMWPRNPHLGSGHCSENGGEGPGAPIIVWPQPVEVTEPIIGDQSPTDPFEGPIVNPCPIDETGGQQQVPNYDNVANQEIKDVMDKYFEDIDGSNANGLQKLFGVDKNGHVDSREIMDFVQKNMSRLSDREIRVLLSASQKEHEISNAYNDEWGAETSGMSRSDIAVWERQQPQNKIPGDEIVFRPYDEDPSILIHQDKRYPLPNSNGHGRGPINGIGENQNAIDKHRDLRWWDKSSYDRGSLHSVDKNRATKYWS